MFTGIIRHVGNVIAIADTPAGKRLTLDLGPLAGELAPGDSLAVNGACLTAVRVDAPAASFDMADETLARTNLAALRAGSAVNLEPPLALGDLLHGHLVQGHVDGLARVTAAPRAGSGGLWRFAAPEELTGQMVPKGSVALDGVSLTLAEVSPDGFGVALIPATLAGTTFGRMGVGARVNVEIDLIGKYLRSRVAQLAGDERPLTLERLKQAGFA